jgi:hypothetical protein
MATLPEGFAVEKPASALPEGFQVESPDFVGASVIEPAITVASALGRSVAGGIAGTLQALNPFAEEGEGARTVEAFTKGAFTPETAAGKEGLKTLGALVQKGVDIVNFPISGLAGLTELISGQGIDQAVDTINSIQEKGVASTAGKRVFEETGSPLAATIAEVLPEATLEIIGLKGAGQAVKQAGKVPGAVVATGKALTPVVEEIAAATKDVSQALFTHQSPTKQKISELIQEGSTDAETARFKLAEGEVFEPTTKLGEFISTGKQKVVLDKVANETIKQGFDEGVIAAVKGASDADRIKLAQMVDIMEKTKKNALFALDNRPSDVAGNTLMERFRVVQDANKTAGKQLDSVAASLKGQFVDHSPAVNSFIDDLESIGVSLVKNEKGSLKPVFKGSDIEGLAGPELAINRIVNRLASIETPDAQSIHRVKRFIDEQVSFGKSAEGLTGRTESILKGLRRNLDGILDEKFPDYNEVNTVYSETIGAIDSLQDAAGRKMNLTGANADKAVGTLLRRLMSNTQSRVNLLDSIKEVDTIAKRHGGFGKQLLDAPAEEAARLKEDLMTQVLFVDELDRVFGPVARTSFQGQIDQAVQRGAGAFTSKQGAVDVAIDLAAAGAEKARGINEAGAFKSIKELLKGNK